MCGNLTKKLLVNSYFLDTCIYINYGVGFGIFHDECTCFFDSSHKKHTSDSVLTEITYFKQFMERFGRDLSIALKQGKCKDVLNHPCSLFRGYGSNSLQHIQNFRITLKGRSDEAILSQYRTAKRMTKELISDALSKTEKPIIASSVDSKFIKLISYINDDADSQIIADAASWAKQYRYRMFCTSDREHILSNKDDLIRDISKHYGRNCLGFVHVKDV